MKKLFLSAAILALVGSASANAQAPESDSATCASRLMQSDIANGTFTKKRYTVNGSWAMDKDCLATTIRFNDDFKTKGGPDLKVYLSPKSLSELDGANALEGAMKLGVLKSNKGAQSYSLTHATDISAYKSVIIQCEAFSVLWGGFDLPGSETP